jgi:hypothetical protein
LRDEIARLTATERRRFALRLAEVAASDAILYEPARWDAAKVIRLVRRIRALHETAAHTPTVRVTAGTRCAVARGPVFIDGSTDQRTGCCADRCTGERSAQRITAIVAAIPSVTARTTTCCDGADCRAGAGTDGRAPAGGCLT